MAKANETSPAIDQYVLVGSDNADFTHLFDEVQLPPAAVVRCFGPGEAGDGYKVSCCWTFRKAGLVFTLYDWKATSLYDVEQWRPDELWASSSLWDLHVGSKAPATNADVAEFIAYLHRTISNGATCQACGNKITGEIHRFSNVPTSAFCSWECQLSKTEITVEEIKLVPITEPRTPDPVYSGPLPKKLRDDRGCECSVFYENQITMPKGHSLICFCPACGCVTQD